MNQILTSRVLVVFLFISTFIVQAQVSFDIKVSKKRLGLNERLRVDFVMNENGDNFNPPSFKGFQVVSGPQQAVSRSWVNGMQSFSKTYTYFLTPKLKGKITLDQAQITINREVYKTSPVIIEVTEAVEKPNDPNNIDYITDENIKLVAEISNSNPYLNEGISVVYKLYFRNPISISDVQELESPGYGDFWSHLIKVGQVRVNNKGQYNGESYNEVVWRKVVLYPQKTGKLNLEPLTLNLSLTVPSSRRDLFGRRIMTQGQKTISAGRRVINVKPLPEKNQPAGFTGAVGQFDFDVILDKDALKATESFQATLKVRGNGNLKLFKLPKINVPNTLEVYEPEHKENVKIKLSGMGGTVEDTYTIVPKYQGRYPIPAVEFLYFDPKTKSYKSVRSQDLLVDVFDGPIAGDAQEVAANLTKQLVQASDTAFRFILLDTKLSPIKIPSFWKSKLFWILLVLPILLLLFTFLFKRFVLGRSEDSASKKQREAQYLARKYLSSAKKAFHDQVAFYEALERALHNYLKAKLKIETSDISKEKITELLQTVHVHEDDINSFIEVFNSCDIARYSPVSAVEMKDDYEKSISVITQIDKQL